MKILITGGAGYVGSILVPELCNIGHEVVVYDNLSFHGNGLLGLFRKPNFRFIKADIRDTKKLKDAVSKSDVIIHLAAIVGYPACKKDNTIAIDVNVNATRSLVNMLTKEQLLIFSSTCSNYGIVPDSLCNEETPLNPQSLYGKTKTEAEQIILNECNSIVYRFSTAFGLSPRLRLDLLVNDFVYKVLTEKYLVVYEHNFMRSFIHVYDMARAFIFALDNYDIMNNEIYNVGNNSMNCSKKNLCELIANKLDYSLHLVNFEKDLDVRNYSVSFQKISSIGYGTTINLASGIDELISGLQVIKIINPYTNVNAF
jgi:nucleoside-diphosphate-sugar epimerase